MNPTRNHFSEGKLKGPNFYSVLCFKILWLGLKDETNKKRVAHLPPNWTLILQMKELRFRELHLGRITQQQCRRPGLNHWVGKIPWSRECQPTPVFLSGEFHGQRSLAGYSPWGLEEWDTTERLTHSAAESERFRSDCKARVFI